jgi:adenylate cyclase
MLPKLTELSLYKPRWVLPLLVTLALFVVSEAMVRFNMAGRIESAYDDAWHQIHGPRYAPNHVSLLLVDEKSLNVYKDTPLAFWTPLFAQATRILKENGAHIVGMDFLFSTTAEQWLRRFSLPEAAQNYDQPLREQLSKGDIVMVTATVEGNSGEDEIILPVRDFMYSLPGLDMEKYISFSNLPPDRDGVIRRYYTELPLRLPDDIRDSNRPRYTFGALLALHATQYDPEIVERIKGLGNRHTPIVFSGPPKSIPSISFAELMDAGANGKPLPESMRALIKDRVVIIGSDYGGLNDNHITPYGTGLLGSSQDTLWMSGPEIQANITENLLAGRFTHPLPTYWRWLIVLLFLTIACAAFRYWPTLPGITVLITLLCIVAAIGYALFKHYLSFPVFAVQAALLLAFSIIYGLRFVGETRTRKHIEQAFGAYTSKAVVNQLVESGRMPELGGEAVDISIMFSDIRNFTTMSEKLSPQRVIEMINTYLSKAAQCVMDEGAHIDKFIGDAIMAEFGAPIKRPDHARCAIRAALALRSNVERFRPWFREHFPELEGYEFRIGVGIHSGAATVGNIGSAQKVEYTALGDTVNVASRLEGVTKEIGCDIAASEATVHAAGTGVITGRSQTVYVKGRKEPIVVYEIMGLEDPTQDRVTESDQTPLTPV